MSSSRASLGNLDLKLLSALVALVEEQSTVRAARRLFLAQPTVSGILARLRNIFGDELLVRNGRSLEPTIKARELVRLIKPHLEALSTAVGTTLNFDPAHDHREFRLGCTDAVAFTLLPKLTKNLRALASNCDLIIRIGDYRTLPEMLASGQITTALGYLRGNLPATTKVKVLRTSRWVILRDTGQPPISSIEDFCSRPQVIVTPRGDLNGFVDDQLHALGRSRRVTVGLSSFALLLAILPDNDMISTVPDFIAEQLARIGNLTIDPCPIDIPLVGNMMAWNIVADSDPAQQWFRDQVSSAFAVSFK